jgi:sulfur-oxidizing protein SoxY
MNNLRSMAARKFRRFVQCIVALMPVFAVLASPVFAVEEASNPAVGAWETMRQNLYGDRDIGLTDETFMSLSAPGNTPDPAATPISLHFGPTAQGKIKRVRLIIDNNPSPLAATLELDGSVPISEIDLRVRIDRYTSVRAIAETSNGTLEMRSAWVKASGGCSAPPGAAAGGTLGEIRVRPSPDAKSLQVNVRHPNNSGFQIDPQTGDPIPPHFVTRLRLSTAGHVLFEADMGISISENPSFRIVSNATLPEPVSVDVVDSKEAHFTATWNGGSTDSTRTPHTAATGTGD